MGSPAASAEVHPRGRNLLFSMLHLAPEPADQPAYGYMQVQSRHGAEDAGKRRLRARPQREGQTGDRCKLRSNGAQVWRRRRGLRMHNTPWWWVQHGALVTHAPLSSWRSTARTACSQSCTTAGRDIVTGDSCCYALRAFYPTRMASLRPELT